MAAPSISAKPMMRAPVKQEFGGLEAQALPALPALRDLHAQLSAEFETAVPMMQTPMPMMGAPVMQKFGGLGVFVLRVVGNLCDPRGAKLCVDLLRAFAASSKRKSHRFLTGWELLRCQTVCAKSFPLGHGCLCYPA